MPATLDDAELAAARDSGKQQRRIPKQTVPVRARLDKEAHCAIDVEVLGMFWSSCVLLIL